MGSKILLSLSCISIVCCGILSHNSQANAIRAFVVLTGVVGNMKSNRVQLITDDKKSFMVLREEIRNQTDLRPGVRISAITNAKEELKNHR